MPFNLCSKFLSPKPPIPTNPIYYQDHGSHISHVLTALCPKSSNRDYISWRNSRTAFDLPKIRPVKRCPRISEARPPVIILLGEMKPPKPIVILWRRRRGRRRGWSSSWWRTTVVLSSPQRCEITSTTCERKSDRARLWLGVSHNRSSPGVGRAEMVAMLKSERATMKAFSCILNLAL
jgi:hypothetical protein